MSSLEQPVSSHFGVLTFCIFPAKITRALSQVGDDGGATGAELSGGAGGQLIQTDENIPNGIARLGV